jgi:hypothetical protein
LQTYELVGAVPSNSVTTAVGLMLSRRNALQRLNCRQARTKRPQPAFGWHAPVHGIIRGACVASVRAAATDAAAAGDAPAEQQLLDLAAVPESSRDECASSNGRSTEEQTAALLTQIRAEVARRRNFAIISHPVSISLVRCWDCPRPANTPQPACPHLQHSSAAVQC